MQRLFTEWLDRINSLLKGEAVGRAIANYLYQIKGKLALSVYGNIQTLRASKPIHFGVWNTIFGVNTQVI